MILTVVLQREPLLNKLVYFLRSNPKGVSDKTCEQDIVAGELSKETLDNYGTLLSALYLPVFQEQGNWGKSDTEHTHQFLQVCTRSADHVITCFYANEPELIHSQLHMLVASTRSNWNDQEHRPKQLFEMHI